MKDRYKIKIPALVCLFLTAVLIFSCSSNKKTEYITIGALLPLTGDKSDEGIRALNGLNLAVTKINKNGGVLGKKLDVIALNDRGDEEYAVQQYNVLKEKNAAAIVGSSYSDVTLALAKASEEDGIPIISAAAANPEITKGRENVFRAIFIDDYQAEIMAYFAYDSLDAKTAVVLINQNPDSFKQISDVFIKTFKELGGTVIAVESYDGENDFSRILRRFVNNKPDVIFFPGNYIPAARLINTVHDIGLSGTYVLGSDAWDGILSYVSNPEAMKNVFYSAPFSFDDQDENVVNFVRDYFSAFSQMPLSGSATAYTCIYILAEAIKEAGSIDRKKLVSAIRQIDMNVITGHINFDVNNNPRTNVYIIQITGGIYSAYEKLGL